MPKYDYLNVTHTASLPTPIELLRELPCKLVHQSFIARARNQICQILEGKDPRILLIVGPCSIHDTTAAKEYAIKLRELSHEVSDSFYVIMRTYFEKPRTTRGWKGLLYDPDLNGSHDIENGLRLTRQLLLDLTEMEIPTAAEFLDPSSAYYFGDLISWACIGARTAASQTHRQMASGLSMPVAFKNSTDGNIEIAINGILNAISPHTFIGSDPQGQICSIQTSGNLYSHMVLRGGKGSPNYDSESITNATSRLKHFNLLPHLLIDCSHDNSQRQHEQQPQVFQSVIRQVVQGNHSIRGLLLESHLFAGNQSLSAADPLRYAVSITDPCLDWQTTENLIRWGHAEMQKREAYNSLTNHIANL
jgi:3-deoxy-7-phosphoheptulonate synthase